MKNVINSHVWTGIVKAVRLNGRRLDCGSVDGSVRATNYEYENKLLK